ncbi:hypothetical protein GCM10023214_67820 [Amycolatopsis dongchuanensis]|uniref:Uncharacterized protein n=1 Tax=Amycolatopsis dongchuanensis TaxID=1070866 RepID=A0ABP8VKP5_9PSEU
MVCMSELFSGRSSASRLMVFDAVAIASVLAVYPPLMYASSPGQVVQTMVGRNAAPVGSVAHATDSIIVTADPNAPVRTGGADFP